MQEDQKFSVRIHGRGGQGVKTFASLIAKAAIKNGLYAQAFPEFGPERRGAAVKAYVRLSDTPIITRSTIENPDFIIIMDESTIKEEETRKGMGSDNQVLINTDKTSDEAKKTYTFLPNRRRIYCVNGEEWVADYEGKIHPSNPIMGKFLKITETVPIDKMKEVFDESFREKLGDKAVEVSLKALEESYYQV